MSLSDIFSIPFLICLSISILLIGCSSIFFYQKISQQDHKIASMIGLLSTMAEETSQIHEFHSKNQMGGGYQQPTANIENKTDIRLIHVSDDENDDDDDSNVSHTSNEEEDDEEEDEDEDEEEDDDEEEEEEEEEVTNFGSKTILINLIPGILDTSTQITENMEDLSQLDYENSSSDEAEDECTEFNLDIENQYIETPNDNQSILFSTDLEKMNTVNIDSSSLKTINLSMFDDVTGDDFVDDVDYSKMNVTKLRKIMIKKGIPDTDKLKKSDILKMLGCN